MMVEVMAVVLRTATVTTVQVTKKRRTFGSTAPSVFPAGDASGKVCSTLITTQLEGIYPKSSLGFTTCTCVKTPVPIYWRFAC